MAKFKKPIMGINPKTGKKGGVSVDWKDKEPKKGASTGVMHNQMGKQQKSQKKQGKKK